MPAWTPPMDDMLTAEWAAGTPTRALAQAIAEAFGAAVTKNSIIGRARRLGLPQRENLGGWAASTKPRKHAPAPAPKPAEERTYMPRGAMAVAVARIRQQRAEAANPAPAPKPPPPPPPAIVLSRTACCRFPLWTDATPKAQRRYCDAPAIAGRSWCPDHLKAIAAPKSKAAKVLAEATREHKPRVSRLALMAQGGSYRP